jgi:hypothetical protein
MYLTIARILRSAPTIIRSYKDMIQYANKSMPSKESSTDLRHMYKKTWV